MDLRVLEYFLMVAREENVSHAAELLHVSQPTISRQLMQLEDEVGKTLFIRGNKSMTLTKEGLLFKNRAEEILSLYQKAVSELSQDQEISGEIVIGSGETDAFYYLADLVAEFQKKYPKVQFHMISGDSDTIKENVDKGLADIGFLFEPVNIEKYAFKKTNIEERWGVLMLPDHPLAAHDDITADDLVHEKLICPRRMSFQSEIYQWFGKQADDMYIAATYNLINMAMMMTQKHIGITLCIEKSIYQDMHLRFVPLQPKIISKPIFIWKHQNIFSLAMEAFIAFISDSKFE